MHLYFFFLFFSSVFAQLSLPLPPFIPPNQTSGSHPSSGGYPNPQWSTFLGNLLYFYEAQRSGNLPSSNRVPWRNNSAVHDGQDAGVDLSGGYYDAGAAQDYLKFTFPLSFALTSICWGATDFGKGYDLANQTAYLDDMLRWGLDWLMRAHPGSNTLYIQVGDADVDNSYWGGDLHIPSPRPSYQINDTSPGTDAAASASAAFSSCASLYSNQSFSSSFSTPASLTNTTYAQMLLNHAQQLYTFAVNATGGQRTYQTSVPAVASSYGSSGYGDDLAMAALFLAKATNSASLYKQAEGYFNKYQMKGQDGVFNWDSVTPGVVVLFAQVNQASSSFGGSLSSWQQEAERYFDRILNKQGDGYLTKGGLLFYPGDSDDASLNPALSAAMLFARYAQIATTSEKQASYLKFAKSQMDYALGKNPMSVPYIVGCNPNSPSNPHSASASGGNNVGAIDTSPAQEAYILYGGVVGGPDKFDNFYDIRSDWPETEVALDSNAAMLTLTAMHVLNDTADPYFTSLQAGEYEKRRPQGTPCDAVFFSSCATGLSKGAKIAMAVVLSVVGVLLMILAAWCFTLFIKRGKKVEQV